MKKCYLRITSGPRVAFHDRQDGTLVNTLVASTDIYNLPCDTHTPGYKQRRDNPLCYVQWHNTITELWYYLNRNQGK